MSRGERKLTWSILVMKRLMECRCGRCREAPILHLMRPLQNCLHGRIAALCATRRLAYLIDMSRLLCCGRLALHPVRLLLQRSPYLAHQRALASASFALASIQRELPSAKCACFQNGARVLRASIKNSQARNAASRCGLATATKTICVATGK